MYYYKYCFRLPVRRRLGSYEAMSVMDTVVLVCINSLYLLVIDYSFVIKLNLDYFQYFAPFDQQNNKF